MTWSETDRYRVAEAAYELYRQGAYDRAAQVLEVLWGAAPEPWTARALSACYLSLGAAERAVALLEAAIRTAPGDLRLRLRLAEALAACGRRAEAARMAQTARGAVPPAEWTRVALLVRDQQLPAVANDIWSER
ncbi:MAG: tetratricopeptide repeat protein [Bryobacteraceae bacterium]|nr:tetratricopeptide repeat protein [Bryobacteraceae bacterium]